MIRLFALLFFIFPFCHPFPQQGVWNFHVDQNNDFVAVSKVVNEKSAFYLRVDCANLDENIVTVNISYVVLMLPCYIRGLKFEDKESLTDVKEFHQNPPSFHIATPMPEGSAFWVAQSPQYIRECRQHETINLEPMTSFNFKSYPFTVVPQVDVLTSSTKRVVEVTTTGKLKVEDKEKPSEKERRKRDDDASGKDDKEKDPKDDAKKDDKKDSEIAANTEKGKIDEKNAKTNEKATPHESIHANGETPQFIFAKEGVYLVSVMITNLTAKFSGSVDIKIRGPDGYLSAVDWPLLPFYGVMCGVYVTYGVVWLIISAFQWRDLLRIQFWIGGVIFLGMLEKAVYYAEYQSINYTGKSVEGAVITAEVISCLKRTLSRMLVIIVSLGFGIVKPRLGPLLHRVVGVGALYFILSMLESFMRIRDLRNDLYKQSLLAAILLAVLDSFICWWIFTSLVQTTRTLRLRRNIVKLTLYRHFTNTLIFAVVASVAFLIWVFKTRQRDQCIEDWKESWLDDAYWRLLFSIVLLVIIILWRPTNNNQRYAFTPLLDAPDDEDEEPPVPDSFEGMKQRGIKNQNHHTSKGVEDDLKWIDENIPSAISDVALPSLLDSDEEIMTTKFEISKMN